MGLTTKEISSSSFNDMISSVDRRSEYVENRAGANVRLNNFLTPYTLDDKSSILNAPCGYSNGVYPSLRPVQTFGPELIDLTQGTAEQPSQWSNITTNSVNFLTGAAGTRYFNVNSTQSTLISGKKYSLTLQISNYSGSDTLGLSTQGNVSINARLDANGTHSEVFTSNGQSLRIFGRATNSATITLSVKEVKNADFDFTRGSAATRVTKDGLIKNVQILSDELVQNGDFEQVGSELVTNGDFATDSDWVKGNGWIISGGKAILVDGLDPTYQIYQSISGLNTKNLKVTFDVTDFSGDAELRYPFRENITGNGSYTFYGVGTLDRVQFQVKSGFTASFSIDNVSVKEVGQNWNFVGDTTVVNNGAKFDNTSVYSEIQQDNVTTSGSRIRLTITVEDYVSGKIIFPVFGINTGNGDPNFYVSANGTYVFEGILYNSAFTIKRAVNGTNLVVSNVSIIEITDDTDLPRIDYTDGTGSLLLEPQSTNLVTYSEDFSEWSPTNIVLTQDTIIAPDGTTTADKIAGNSVTAQHRINFTTTNVSGATTFSFFAKSGEYTSCWARIGSSSSFFDLENGVASEGGGITSSIENFGNGWYRCIMTKASSSANETCRINITTSYLNPVDFSGDNVSGIYLWGAQHEQLPFATSYIPTSGSTSTRNAEVCNNAGSSDLINSTEGVLYAEIAALADDGTFRYITLSDGTTSNRIIMRYQSVSNRIDGNIIVGGSTVASLAYTSSDITTNSKISIKWKVNDFALWVDGIERDTDASGITFANNTLNTLKLTNAVGSGSFFYGNVKSVAVFKEALTDEELAKITSTTQQEVFYEMRDRMLQIDADYYEFGDYTTRLKKLF